MSQVFQRFTKEGRPDRRRAGCYSSFVVCALLHQHSSQCGESVKFGELSPAVSPC
jgi:hypothetical protein